MLRLMNTTYHYDEKSKKYHPVPAALVEMIRRDVFNGSFCVVGYFDGETPDLSNGFSITDGRSLRAKVRKALAGTTTDFMVKRWNNEFTAEEYNAYVNA